MTSAGLTRAEEALLLAYQSRLASSDPAAPPSSTSSQPTTSKPSPGTNPANPANRPRPSGGGNLLKRPRIVAGGALVASSASHATSSAADDAENGANTKPHPLEAMSVMTSSPWSSLTAEAPLIVELSDLGVDGQSGKNTLVVKTVMPKDSKRFTFNISSTPAYSLTDPTTQLLYHFNPRDGWGKTRVVQNSFQSLTWGQASDVCKAHLPFEKDVEFEFRVVVCKHGFAVYVDQKLVATMHHRASLPPERSSLYFVVPVWEDSTYGAKERESVVVSRVMWARSKPLARLTKEASSAATEVLPSTPAQVERTLFFWNLPKDESARTLLMNLLGSGYDIAKREDGELYFHVIPDAGKAYVRFENDYHTRTAVAQLNDWKIAEDGRRLFVRHANAGELPPAMR